MYKQSETGLYTAEAIFSALQNLSESEKQKFVALIENKSYAKANPNYTKSGKTEQAAEAQIFIQDNTGF